MLKFTVYGAGKIKLLETMIGNWMRETDTPYDIVNVIDVDEMLREGIESVPTIIIQPTMEGDSPASGTVSQEFKKYHTMDAILGNRIRIATDFSPPARNAFVYGIQLARHLERELEVIHVLNPATDLNTGYMIDPEIESRKRDLLDEWVADAEKSGVTASGQFILGFPVEELLNLSKDRSNLLVVGARGDSGLLEKVFGSVASNLARRAEAPILVVPHEASFKPFKEVVYAAAAKEVDRQAAGLIRSVVVHFGGRLHVIHVDNGIRDDWNTDRFPKEEYERLEMVTEKISDTNVPSGISKYADKVNADLIVATSRHRDFWDNLLHHSVTKELSINPSVPVLILHETKK